MSTRRLIAAALVCGLAILLAGGIFLVNLAANRDKLTVPDFLAVGQTAEVGGVRATVLGSETTDRVVVLHVRLEPADEPLADAGEGWALVIGTARDPLESDAAGTPCAGREVPAGGAFECDLAFAGAQGTAFVEYARGDGRARWRLD